MQDAPGSQGRSTAGLSGHAASLIEGKPLHPPPAQPPSPTLDPGAEPRVLETLAALAECRAKARGDGAASPTPRLRELLRSRLDRLASSSTLHVSSEECAPPGEGTPGVENLLAILPASPGSGRRAIYLVAGFDAAFGENQPGDCESRHDGACAAVLEAVRALSRHPLLASIVLVLCDGGTRDALGAAFRATTARQMHAFDVAAVLCLGAINSPGRWDDAPPQADRVRVFAGGGGGTTVAAADSPGHQVARVLEESGRLARLPTAATLVARANALPPVPEAERFIVHDFPVATLHEPSPRDVQTEPPNSNYVIGVARLLVAGAERLALAPPPPEGAALDNHTIRWRATDDPNLAGYEILWRSTTSHQWENARWVARPDRAPAPADPSTHFFGVVAVARSGHRSPAAFAG